MIISHQSLELLRGKVYILLILERYMNKDYYYYYCYCYYYYYYYHHYHYHHHHHHHYPRQVLAYITNTCDYRCCLQDFISKRNIAITLHWRHNDHDGVSNHQPHGCLLNRLFRRRSKKTSKLRVTGLCMGNSPGPVNSPHKGPVTRKMFPFDDVIIKQGGSSRNRSFATL